MQNFIFSTQPGKEVRQWQSRVMAEAHKNNYLDNHFNYRHYFYSVFKRDVKTKQWMIDHDGDAKRCLPTTTKIWMGDYTSKSLGDVQIGDSVIGWERGISKYKKKYYKKFFRVKESDRRIVCDSLTRAVVTDKVTHREATMTIRLASGQSIRCTSDHQWLCYTRHEYKYKRADHIRAGDLIAKVDFTDPGNCPQELRETAAWLAGFYDGEGCHRGITQTEPNGKGNLVNHVIEAFNKLGFNVTIRRENKTGHPDWAESTRIEWLGGRQEALRFLKWVPSYRFRAQWADAMILNSRFRWRDAVVGIEEGQIEDVICITTTTGNYVADGICSHNCVAFRPQSDGSAIQTEVILRMADYVGFIDWLRLIIHDEIVCEVPEEFLEDAATCLHTEMVRPIPELNGLVIGAETKFGKNLAPYDAETNIDGMQEMEVSIVNTETT